MGGEDYSSIQFPRHFVVHEVTKNGETLIPLAQFSPGRAEYEWSPKLQGFTHNFDSDLQGVIIWERGRSEQTRVIEELKRRFLVIAGYEVRWSPQHVSSNFNRLYGRHPGDASSRHEWAGSGPFLYFVILEKQPRYVYRRNLSGRVELTSQSIAEFKAWARSQYDKRLPHVIHSSNNLGEFMKDAVLLLGEKQLKKTVSVVNRPENWNSSPVSVEKDLEGAGGWHSLDHLYRTLSLTQKWTLLRPSEGLLKEVYESGSDIDILCERRSDFASFANSVPRLPGREGPGYFTTVGSERVLIDLREPGDFDLDPGWQRQLLSSYSENQPPTLQPSDQFFYLAYHCIFHKGTVKAQHAMALARLAKDIGINLSSPDDSSGKPSAELKEITSGFLSATGYRVTDPATLGFSLEDSGGWKKVAPVTLVSQNVPLPLKLPENSVGRRLFQIATGVTNRVRKSKSYRLLQKKTIRTLRFLRWIIFQKHRYEFRLGAKLIEVNSHDGRFMARVVGRVLVPVRNLRVSLIDWQSAKPLRRYETSIFGSPHFLFALDIVRGNNSLNGREAYVSYKMAEHLFSPKEAARLADGFESQVQEIQSSLGDSNFGDIGILATIEGLSVFRVNDGVHRLAAVAAVSGSAKVSAFIRI